MDLCFSSDPRCRVEIWIDCLSDRDSSSSALRSKSRDLCSVDLILSSAALSSAAYFSLSPSSTLSL